MKVADPICGMTIEAKDAFAFSLYKGTAYYFCSERCKDAFDRDPDAASAMKEAREKSVDEERAQTIERMVDKVAHEMRNPLTSIGGFVRKVHGMLPQGDPKRKYLKMVIEDVMRLESMIEQLVDLKTTTVSHMEPADIKDVILNVLKTFENELRENSVEVRAELADNLSPVHLDKERIAIALANLIANAREAMQEGTKILRIASRLRDKNVEITISDTGKGIPKDKIKYVFDPFFTSKIYGPGLGLTFAQRIVQQHGGTITAESETGKGTTFVIQLPLGESLRRQQAPPAAG